MSEFRVHHLVLGTAGHIDHGKTSLIRALTNIETDTLREEQERGITIDVGLAHMRLNNGAEISIIDVPGHEKFVKNMVAGATSIDLVMLVVAADDSVMPQTREHLQILTYLGLKRGLIALTKIDKCDPDERELAIEDVRDFVRGTFLETAPICPVSSITKEGLPELVATINRLVGEIPQRSSGGVFRMPIQRVFPLEGHGTTITGIPVSGTIHAGDPIEINPGAVGGKIRSLQAHGHDLGEGGAAHRLAITIPGVDHTKVRRGMVASVPGYFRAGDLVECRFTYRPPTYGAFEHLKDKPLKSQSEIRFHTGTIEMLGKLFLLEGTTLQPGESTFVQVRLAEPVVTVPGDRFVLRLASPSVTIGGGRVVGMSAQKLKPGRDDVLAALTAKNEHLDEPAAYTEAVIAEAGDAAVGVEHLQRQMALTRVEFEQVLATLEKQKKVRSLGRGHWIAMGRFREAKKDLVKFLADHFKANPHTLTIAPAELRKFRHVGDDVFEALLDELSKEKTVEVVRNEIRYLKGELSLTPHQAALLEKIYHAFQQGKFQPPTLEDIEKSWDLSRADADKVIGMLVAQRRVKRVSESILFSQSIYDEARKFVVQTIEKNGKLTSNEFRDWAQSSRKWVIPLLEYFDKIGLTRRIENDRTLRNKEAQ